MNWTMLDLNGDGLLDLVVTDEDRGNQVGVTKWHVYRGTCD